MPLQANNCNCTSTNQIFHLNHPFGSSKRGGLVPNFWDSVTSIIQLWSPIFGTKLHTDCRKKWTDSSTNFQKFIVGYIPELTHNKKNTIWSGGNYPQIKKKYSHLLFKWKKYPLPMRRDIVPHPHQFVPQLGSTSCPIVLSRKYIEIADMLQ